MNFAADRGLITVRCCFDLQNGRLKMGVRGIRRDDIPMGFGGNMGS